MIKFHNAFDNEGRIVNIEDIKKVNRAPKYFCIGCGSEMSAVLGDKREHHFRHKEAACSWESYLHKLGKKKLKERFETCKDFIIRYVKEYICEKSQECKLANYTQKCNRRELYQINLKELYDTCQEEVVYKGFRADLMLSHSKYPEREPIFLEISVTHDCEQEKLASGIKIIELKIANENDVLCPLEEKESLFIDTISELYSHRDLPQVRFYNFPRESVSQRLLQRFWVSCDDKGILRGNCIEDNLNCQNVETNHREDSIFEIAIPTEVFRNHKEILGFGIMRAFRKGIDIKYCCFCREYNTCICTFNVEKINKENGEKFITKQCFQMASLTDKNIDKFACASQCGNYKKDGYLIRIEQYYRKLPYWEWKSDDEEVLKVSKKEDSF